MKRQNTYLCLAFIMMLAWLLPSQTMATPAYVEQSENYMVMLNGANTVKIQVPVYDQDGADHWVRNGNLKVTYNGQTKTLFHWRRNGSTDSSSKDIFIHFKTEMGGEIEVTQGNSANHFTLTSDDGDIERLVYRNNDGKTYTIYAVWRLPYDMLGSELKFEWDVKLDYTNGLAWDTQYDVKGLSSTTFTMPKADATVIPQVTDATLAYSEKGKLEIPWFVATTNLTEVHYEYIDEYGHLVTHTLPTNMNNGTIYLDATVPHRNFRVVVSYTDNNGYQINNISSVTQNLKMVHAPLNFNVRALGDRKSKVQLEWNIQHLNTDDLMDMDFFEVQRSLSGKEEDFETIGSVSFELDEQNYSYVDSTLINAILKEDLTNGGTLKNLTYRIRRTGTQTWEWDGNTAAAAATRINDDMHLLRIASYTAKWEDERAFTVRVNWDYGDEYNAVWDERASMIMQVTSTNTNGEPVDTLTYTLNADERAKRYKIINLDRSCVDFKINMYVEQGTSPLPLYEDMTPFFFAIHNEDDWNTFRNMVNSAMGQREVNARLYADITTGNSCADISSPYLGIFDGNGHTFTSTIVSVEYQAMFRYAKKATIKNLNVKGSVTSSGMYTAGIIACVVGDTVRIENCNVSAEIKSTISGDASNGGFVASLGKGTVLMSNCQFNGMFTGDNCTHNGGFIGYMSAGTKATLTSCFFKPTKLATKIDGCDTYARADSDAQLTLVDCYCTEPYSAPVNTVNRDGRDYMVLRTPLDWTAFTAKVAAAAGKTEVYAIMDADITATIMCAYNNTAPFRGIFDGNGHTLTFNYESTIDSRIAPFRYVTDCTIRNLTVKGKVKGTDHTAGLIGETIASAKVVLENLDVQTQVTCVKDHAGGIIGHSFESSIVMEDVKSSGSIIGTVANTYGGAVIGWGHTTTWNLRRVYENVEYKNVANQAFCYYYSSNAVHDWGGNASSTSCVSGHAFDKVAEANRNVVLADKILSIMNGEESHSWEKVGDSARPVMTAIPIGGTDMNNEQLLVALGCGWVIDGNVLQPEMWTIAASTKSYTQPTLPTFRHESIGKIDKTLKAQTRQSSVVLTWATDGNPIDYFTVLRRLKDSNDAWDTLVTNIDQMSYEDTSVSPLEDYEYKVRATNDCEGLTFTETDICVGACKHSGMVEGYVRFQDGTGVPGIEVEIVSGSIKAYAKTDESGYFMSDELTYNNQKSIIYTVTPIGTGGVKFEVDSYSVTFDGKSNHEVVHEFIINNGLQFNAYVMYDGTSIPVKGVRFRVNGELLYNAKGEYLETDFEGHASFYVLNNTRSTIQTEMEGHSFVDGGWYKGAEGVVFTDKVGQAYFYDATLVKLTGRIVGGNDQGKLPLDNNLSRNNLGSNVTMVLTLEGNNTSWLVYDNVNPTITKRNLNFDHPGGNGHKTKAQVERKRMVVKPDSVTGEYVLMLPPVRWKVQQVYCDGYPTLFQDGMVSEVIDLTDCLVAQDSTYQGRYTDVDGKIVSQPAESYNYRYNRIYHAPVEITYKQLTYDTFDYFGDRAYMATTITGIRSEVPLAYKNANDTTKADYTFGYPVFSLNHRYPIEISVVERYPWNGVKGSPQEDLVRIGGGKVTVHNGMKNGVNQQTVTLDSLGQGIFMLEAEQTTRLLTGENALRTVSMTLEQDGTTYEAKPLKGYILNMFALTGSKDAIAVDQPLLIDVLRDPPGGGSSATLSKGSKLKLNYTVDMKFKAGLNLKISRGTSLDNYSGVVLQSGNEYGLLNSGQTDNLIDLAIIFSGSGKKGYSYTMSVGEDITTSSAATMVGADADLYIGVVQNMIMTPVSSIRAIPDSIYRCMLGREGGKLPTGGTIKYGSLVHIAEGRDSRDSLYHLVRDESLAYGPQVTSQFVHSQKHILTELMPKLANEINAMIFTGTKQDAQKQANATGKNVYWSKVPAGHDDFGVEYEVISPAGRSGGLDELAQKFNILLAWVNMIANNEYEKLNAYDLVSNYDVDGGSKVVYNETFDSEYSVAQSIVYPFSSADYFGSDGEVNGWDVTAKAASVLASQPALAAALKALTKKIPGGTVKRDGLDQNGKAAMFSVEMKFAGSAYKFQILPAAEYSSTGTYGTTHNYTRKESFTISMDAKSHLNFDVYRVRTLSTDTLKALYADNFDVFHNANFNNWMESVNTHVREGVDFKDAIYPRSFVYRTRGGATCNSWENERRTVVYHTGTLLDERTKKICNPKITLDRQSVSGISMGDPARFKVYLTNESEQPESATGGQTLFNFFLYEDSNPNGAKIYVDGSPLNGSGFTVILNPGKVVEKTIEVYAGSEFDYEGITLGVAHSSDFTNTQDKVKFDVHYLRTAGPVEIASPGDKWVMNTDAQYDANRGWFIPITINGFNKYQKNFDHIEFQYKESQRGEDFWTNLCSYYADSLLMAQASGMRKMIPENGNITTEFYGDGTVMEKAYDLRAVLYCRDGNSFLTTASKIISGVKDTRRPQLFGLPEPKDGMLTWANNIIFNFSEDIEYNYLNNITNFEVRGEVNNDNVSEAVSLQFKNQASVESEAQRNFSGKDMTIDLMVKPDATGRDMPLFSHGTNGKKLQLWLTKDFKLKAVIDDHTYTSADTIVKGAFTQVAVAISQKDSIRFFNGGKQIGSFKLEAPYNGTGPLIFGRTNETDRMRSQYYEGRMMEARIWQRALTGGQVGTTYGSRRLTGYEMGLVDYYPMNEGNGDYALDHTQGANAQLIGASWAMPRGFSLHVDWDDRGLALNQNALNRTPEQDYTLMFWFKTNAEGRGVLLSNGAGSREETGAENLFNIAFEAEKLMYRTHGMGIEVPGNWSDDQWHHYAMTVNRSRGVANIYMDGVLRSTFEADSLGGISGGHPLIGAALSDVVNAEGKVVTTDTRNWLRGNIDELCFFAQALPLTLIKNYSAKSPGGDEAGLLTYLSFDRQERQKDNDIVLVPYTYSKKVYKDDKGEVRYVLDPVTKEPTTTPVRDYVFVDTIDVIEAHIDGSTAAPVVPFEELHNLTFSFVGKDNQIMIGIDEQAARINHRNIYVTLRDVEDKNGNTMASPATACFYVTNSVLQWMTNRHTATVTYGQDNKVNLLIINNSANSHTYTIDNCPKWLTLDTYSDIIGPNNIAAVTAKINKDLNVGNYNEIIYLTDEDGVSEPLYLNLTVEGITPDWAWNVPTDLLENSMNISGRVYLNDEIDIDVNDIVGVFDKENRCHGFAHIEHSALTGECGLFLTVYDNKQEGRELSFKLWQYATGRELMLTADGKDKITFKSGTVMGTDTPVKFEGGSLFVQTFDLKEGWNWISFNVASEKLFNLNTLLDGLPWQNGDVLTDLNSNVTLAYTDGHWLASGSMKNTVLSPRKAYAIKVTKDIQFPVGGHIIKAEDARTIELKSGWNGIGYTPMMNLSVETALSDYYSKAKVGDVIKSHTQFAYFTETGGTGRWRGSLQYMKPGEGYMLLRKDATPTSFRYPFYEVGSTFIDQYAYTVTTANAPSRTRNSMTLSAVIDGFEPMEGDRLVAYVGAEKCGEAIVTGTDKDSEPLYLNIGGEQTEGIWFAIERDDEIVASTAELMMFRANAVVGSPDEPTAISFTRMDYEDGRWYSIDGMSLTKRPVKKGIYIYNGKKLVIK